MNEQIRYDAVRKKVKRREKRKRKQKNCVMAKLQANVVTIDKANREYFFHLLSQELYMVIEYFNTYTNKCTISVGSA